MGEVLHSFANGEDIAPVTTTGYASAVKSIGNSTTTPRDLECDEDVRMILFVLSESVAARLREHHFKCRTVQIHVRDSQLISFERQAPLSRPSSLSSDIARLAMALFSASYDWRRPVRSIGVRGCDLVSADTWIQLSLLEDETRQARQEKLECAIDHLRRRYGNAAIGRAVLLSDRSLGRINPKDDHVIFPVGYFRDGPPP